MLYTITNYIGCGDKLYNSEPMEYEKALKIFNAITKQARRGLRPFPDLLDENGIVIM